MTTLRKATGLACVVAVLAVWMNSPRMANAADEKAAAAQPGGCAARLGVCYLMQIKSGS